QHDTYSVDLECMKSIDNSGDHLFILPTHHQKSGGPVPEIVLAHPFPNKMPAIVWVHAHNSPAIATHRLKVGSVTSDKAPLTIGDRVGIFAGGGRHEANAEEAAVGGVTEAVCADAFGGSSFSELAFNLDISERISGIGPSDRQCDFNEVVSLNCGSGL